MPELPEVETVCRGLHVLMKGQVISKITLRRKNLRTPFPPGMEKMLQGRTVEKVYRRAKYILIEMSGGKTLLAHLGMSGRMAAVSANAPLDKHDHVVFDLKNKRRLVFRDPRRFGVMDVADTAELSKHKLLRGIGPEPLGKELSLAYVAGVLKGKKPAIKVAIMDQRLIAGIGNIYACEALFYSKIDPRKPAGKVTAAEIKKLIPAIQKVLNRSIELGGSSLRDYVQTDGKLGSFQNNFAVYDRTGKACGVKACTCHQTGGIRQITQGGRSTFFCPVQQR